MTEQVVTPPIETTVPLPIASAKKPAKLLYIFGGVAIILVTIGLAITFFGGGKTAIPAPATNESGEVVAPPGFVTYTNTPHFFTIAFPPKWSVVETSPNQEGSILIQTDGPAIMQITSFKAPSASLEEYFASLQDGRSASKSSPVKVGSYDGVERLESWTKTSLQPVITYSQIQDKMYVFSLLPSDGKNAISNDTLLSEYRSVLATFNLTTTTSLGVDWVEYVTSKVEGLAFPAFRLTHPQSWAVKESSENGTLTISIYRNNYEISVYQAPVGGAVCLFKDSPTFQGSSGDLRGKEYTEFTSKNGLVMRRYFNQNQGEKSTFFFCDKEANGPYFNTPTDFGGVSYFVPAKYDVNIVKEMDEIVKTFSSLDAAAPTPVSNATPSATKPWSTINPSLC